MNLFRGISAENSARCPVVNCEHVVSGTRRYIGKTLGLHLESAHNIKQGSDFNNHVLAFCVSVRPAAQS